MSIYVQNVFSTAEYIYICTLFRFRFRFIQRHVAARRVAGDTLDVECPPSKMIMKVIHIQEGGEGCREFRKVHRKEFQTSNTRRRKECALLSSFAVGLTRDFNLHQGFIQPPRPPQFESTPHQARRKVPPPKRPQKILVCYKGV